MGFWRETQILEHAVQTPEIDGAVAAILAAGAGAGLVGRPAAGLDGRPAQWMVICELGDH